MWPVMLLTAAAAAQAPSVTLATCGASSGTGYYVIDGGTGQWNKDGIPKGGLTFTVGDDDKPNVIYRTDYDGTIDTRADGGLVFMNRNDAAKGEFGMVVIYPKSGTSETYSVLRLANGKRQLVWTQNKAHVGPDGRLSSAKVLTADCD